jgi:AcrR family transcriptional regulator
MVKRQYESPRRDEQARRTRAAVLATAHRLFVAEGYAATSIRNIADTARVSEQTVYRLFGDKATLLRDVVLTAVSGPDEATVARQSTMMEGISRKRDPRERLTLVARWIGESYERGLADLEYVVLTAAPVDPRVTALASFMAEQRYLDTKSLVSAVMAGSKLPEGVTIEDMTDYVYAVESSAVYRILVEDRGWTTGKYVDWFVRLVEALFLADDRNPATKPPSG